MPFSARGFNRRKFLKLLAVAGVTAAAPLLGSRPAAARQGRALLVSDIHFDPYFDGSLTPALIRAPASGWRGILASSPDKRLGCYGLETNYNLLDYGLRAMRAACPRPDCVIYTGDLPCHGVWDQFETYSQDPAQREDFLTKLVEFMGLLFRAYFPRATVYFTLGNNDSFCQDYKIVPQGPYLRRTAPVYYKTYLGSPAAAEDFYRDYQGLGCYSLPGPGPGLTVLSINNIYLSTHWSCQCCPGPVADPAGRQLDWLEAKLRQAENAGQAVWLMMHIPPGIDAFKAAKLVDADGKLSEAPLDLTGAGNQRLLDIMRAHAGVLRAGFAGHTHMDHFRALTQGPQEAPAAMLRVTPALNPMFGGNPAFQVLTYSLSDYAPLNLATYYLDLEAQIEQPGLGHEAAHAPWRFEYDFNAAYGAGGLDAASLWALSQEMRGNAGLREKFRAWYNASRLSAPGFSQHEEKLYWCALAHLEPSDYLQAFNSQDLGGLLPRAERLAA